MQKVVLGPSMYYVSNIDGEFQNVDMFAVNNPPMYIFEWLLLCLKSSKVCLTINSSYMYVGSTFPISKISYPSLEYFINRDKYLQADRYKII